LRVAVVSIRTAFARLSTAALTLPILLGGGAAPAVAAHVMTPSVGSPGQSSPLGDEQDLVAGQLSCPPIPPRPFCYGPAQLRGAYDIQPLIDSGIDGTGATIVIIDAFSSPTLADDVAAFDAAWGLPDAILHVVTPDGIPPFDPSQGAWAVEMSLDVEWAHAIAPGAHLELVLAKSSDDVDLLSATRYAVDHNLGDVITQSFGEAESCADPELLRQEHAVFERAASKGITLVAGSGDKGAVNFLCDGSLTPVPAAATPASDPDVTAVGGTRLTLDPSTGAYVSETGWHDASGASGGGFSTVYRRPGYQAPFISDNAARGLPDVAYAGSGFGSFLIVANHRTRAIFGTSAGAPQWAGIDALSRQFAGHRQSQLNIRLYHLAKSDSYGAAFHDISTGNNTWNAVTGFEAGRGWDPVTGLGTPDVAKLVPLLS
jgi:subtilase family serine protease